MTVRRLRDAEGSIVEVEPLGDTLVLQREGERPLTFHRAVLEELLGLLPLRGSYRLHPTLRDRGTVGA